VLELLAAGLRNKEPKRVAWSDPVTIADAKAIGAPVGAKVNDVLVAAMAGALRAYLRGRGVDVDGTTLRAMVPVDLRPPERALVLGNDFGLVILELSVARRTSLGRLPVTKANMDELKRSAEPVAMRVPFDIFGRMPKAVQDIPVAMFGGKASVVMTNVAGASQTLYLTGVPIERIMFWVPHPGEQLGLGVSIQSYRGQATLAVVADAALVPDPARHPGRDDEPRLRRPVRRDSRQRRLDRRVFDPRGGAGRRIAARRRGPGAGGVPGARAPERADRRDQAHRRLTGCAPVGSSPELARTARAGFDRRRIGSPGSGIGDATRPEDSSGPKTRRPAAYGLQRTMGASH
jgi:hypothetical protein